MPSKCLVEAGFDCKDYVIHEGDFSINLANKKGDAIKNLAILNITSDSYITAPTIGTDCSITPTTVGADASFVISCTTANMFQGLAGEKVKIEFDILYNMSRGTYTQVFSGEIFAPVQ